MIDARKRVGKGGRNEDRLIDCPQRRRVRDWQRSGGHEQRLQEQPSHVVRSGTFCHSARQDRARLTAWYERRIAPERRNASAASPDDRRAAEQRDELAALHSITSSARASRAVSADFWVAT